MVDGIVHAVSIDQMRAYLSSSLSSVNRNKLNGLLAEVDFRQHVKDLGFEDRVSAGGWIARSEARGGIAFGKNAAVFFPETIVPGVEYDPTRTLPVPHPGLHTICATFHQIGIRSYYCAVRKIEAHPGNLPIVQWEAIQLGVPTAEKYNHFPDCLQGFSARQSRYNYLRYHTDSAAILDNVVPEEFSKENLRVAFADRYFSEISDLDGLFWGQEKTYPIEIKEKTVAPDRSTGGFFGLDVGPFVKLAYYAAKRGNLHSLFVVREIDDVESRGLVDWWFITFDELAQFASWNFVGGGKNMQGGRSATIRIPKSRFRRLDRDSLSQL